MDGEVWLARRLSLCNSIRNCSSTQDINLSWANNEPYDLWSDGKTLWVADEEDGRLYAYSLSTRQRDPAKDVILGPESLAPRGIWSDGETWWVVDAGTNKLYRYDPPPPLLPQRLRARPGETQVTLTWQRPEQCHLSHRHHPLRLPAE